MALFFNDPQRRGLSHVIEALQRLEDSELSIERAQRYSDPPPAYPSSGETTQPASPTEGPVIDESMLRAQRNGVILQSTPDSQFSSQTRRERERIIYQLEEKRYGRNQTLFYDNTADLLANAENNVRARWVEQDIWKEEWGPAWPKGAEALDNRWLSSHENTGGPRPFGCWGHEKEPESIPAPESETKSNLNIFVGWGREEPNTTTVEVDHASAPDVTKEPAATSERDTSASRPYQQFLFQLAKEREWIRDELQYKRHTTVIDIDAIAYESTKKNWIEDEIWNPLWGELPGMTWMHEDLLEGLHQTSNLPSDAASNDGQRHDLPSPKYNIKLSSAPEAADTSNVVIARARGKRKRGIARVPTVNGSPRSAEPAGRVLRGVRSSKVMKPSESMSTVPNTRLQKRNHRVFGPDETFNSVRQNSTSRKPGSGNANSAHRNERASAERPIRTSVRSSLGLVGSRMSKSKSKLEDQRQLNACTKNATLQLPSTGALSNTGQRRPSIEDQLPVATKPRRSERIAAQMRNIPVKRKRKTAASLTSNSKGQSCSTLRATSPATDGNRMRQRQCNSNGGIKARRRLGSQ